MPPNQSEPNFTSEPKEAARIELLTFPQFDSLPAASGLTNLQAFQLSLQHALALLPVIDLDSRSGTATADEAGRFTLR